MKTLYGFKCTNCGEEYENLCHYCDIATIIEEDKCSLCGADLRQTFGIGLVKFNGSDFTKKTT